MDEMGCMIYKKLILLNIYIYLEIRVPESIRPQHPIYIINNMYQLRKLLVSIAQTSCLDCATCLCLIAIIIFQLLLN